MRKTRYRQNAAEIIRALADQHHVRYELKSYSCRRPHEIVDVRHLMTIQHIV
jgi:hypothetical protein